MRYSLLLITLLLFVIQLSSQEKRPKVGLVLSGGSAHGLAHIGVLQYLEEHNVPVDYITGTSMGSIIGALYAIGHTAEEIEKITAHQNWGELLATDVPLDEVAPSEKEYHNRFIVSFQSKEGEIGLPQGFFNSQKLDLQLNKMFRAAQKVTEFEQLPYPFKCVAVDIETGEIIVLDKGFLGHAVRASMSIPSVFSPVVLNDRLLVDGGLRRNFPVQEVLDMGADIVIGVYVGSELDNRDDLNSLVDILGQSAFMMGILDSREQKKNVDILIEPDVKDLPAFGFQLYNVLIREGYEAAKRQNLQIDSISRLFSQMQVTKPQPLRQPEAIVIGHTGFANLESPFLELARFKYRNGLQIKSGSTKFDKITDGVTRIFGTKHFENVNYVIRNNDPSPTLKLQGQSGKSELEILTTPRKEAVYSLGMNFMSTSGTSFIINGELRNILARPSVLYLTGRMSENWGGKLDFKYRLGRRKSALLTLGAIAHRYDQKLYTGEELAEEFTEIHSRSILGLGFEPNNTLFINGFLGVEHFYLEPNVIERSELNKYRRLDFIVGGDLRFQNVDDVYFATNGHNLLATAGYNYNLGGRVTAGMGNEIFIPEDRSFVFLEFKGDKYFSLTKSLVGQLEANAGWKSHTSLINNYRLGGLEDRDGRSIAVVGLNTHQFHYSAYTNIGISLRWNIFEALHLSLHASHVNGKRTFTNLENSERDRWTSFMTYGIKGSLKTPIGPVQLAYGRNEFTGSWNTNFTFGYTFF